MGCGLLFVISAPSGAGKTSLTRLLLAEDPGVKLSVSHTTRRPRPGELDGRDYCFIDISTFLRMREAGEFLESAEVHGNHYGTSKHWIETQRRDGHDVLLEIDWQGARQVRKCFPDMVGVFVLPPSVEELRRRLSARGQDDLEVINRRVRAAKSEMAHAGEFEYVIINNDLTEALDDLKTIVGAARLGYSAQSAANPGLFSELMEPSG